MKNIILIFIFITVIFSEKHVLAQAPSENDKLVEEHLEQWKDMKFGLLMHWGPYSKWGVVESWSICSEDEPWCRRNISNYVEYCKKYTDLKKTFNPKKFDPQKWAEAAQYAGMKYVIFTTKHHDGFCMFDTKETSYKITDKECPFSSNPKANVTREIFNSFRNKGFITGAYFSKPDWHNNDYWAEEWATPDRNVNYSIKKYPARWEKFKKYTYNQINELTSSYGKVDILWLDGGWVNPDNRDQDIDMPAIAAMARKNQPGMIIVDRAVHGKYENYRTPEQEIPEKPLDYPWETCMTMATSWSYVPGDVYKPTEQLIHMLVDIVAKGGNFLLNIGPSPEGEFADTAYARLKEIGDWMKVNGEAIYKTRPVEPYKTGKVCYTSLPEGTFNVIYLADHNEVKMPANIVVEGFQPSDGSVVTLLGTDKTMKWKREGNGFIISVPSVYQNHPPCKYAWSFKVKMNNRDR